MYQRRIRHITGVQIRNLTPFPVRDSFTSALSLPLEQSHLSASGITDDLASILSKKRTRKVSTNSTASRRSIKREDGVVDIDTLLPAEAKGKVASTSTVMFSNGGNISMSPSNGQSFSYKPTHSLRDRRRRTSSVTSFGSTHLTGPKTQSNAPPAVLSTSSFLPDHSQAALQKIINSRLVETFITISLPSGINPLVDPSPVTVKSLRSAPMKEPSPSNFRVQSRPSYSLQHEGLPRTRSRSSRPDSAPPTRTSFKLSNGNKPENKPNSSLAARLVSEPSRSGSPSRRRSKVAVSPLPEIEQVSDSELDSPVYFSPIHRPSTNPFFPIDAKSGCDFPQGADISGQRLRIEIWGRILVAEKGGHKHPERMHSTQRQISQRQLQDWKMLEAWDISLSEMLPLPEIVRTFCEHFGLPFILFSR